MNTFPLFFKRRSCYGKEGDLLNYALLTIEIEAETEICLDIAADTFFIDWGDGDSGYILKHRYENAGMYKVRLIGIAIHRLELSKANLVELDLEKCGGLEYLSCAYNRLKFLNLSFCPCMTILDCSHNELEALHLKEMDRLCFVDCSANQLEECQVTDCNHLLYFYASHNRLQELRISSCKDLVCLDIGENNFAPSEMNRFIDSLPAVSRGACIMIDKNPGGGKDYQTATLRDKGWSIV